MKVWRALFNVNVLGLLLMVSLTMMPARAQYDWAGEKVSLSLG